MHNYIIAKQYIKRPYTLNMMLNFLQNQKEHQSFVWLEEKEIGKRKIRGKNVDRKKMVRKRMNCESCCLFFFFLRF